MNTETQAEEVRGKTDGAEGRYAIVASRFNAPVVDALVAGALETLEGHGVTRAEVTVVRVPGAFELPQAALRLARSARYDAVIALGAVIRGGTPHFEYVSSACAQGLARASLETEFPLVFGVLTTDDAEQARSRAGGARGNKGEEAALAALEMVSVYRQLWEPLGK